MTRGGDTDSDHPDLMAFARRCIPQIPIVPRAFPARDFPGFACFAPAIQQLVALLPAQHKADVALKHQTQPGAAGELAIPQMADGTPPRFDTAGAELPQLGLLI